MGTLDVLILILDEKTRSCSKKLPVIYLGKTFFPSNKGTFITWHKLIQLKPIEVKVDIQFEWSYIQLSKFAKIFEKIEYLLQNINLKLNKK